ncbi:hypothetical protein [Paraburkholderia tropica]|uniref:hypothetical protein n=1 Tax=Paraburkholderia tropica TaxID=92647 RepID=UPI002ABD86F3|nr:hypothetical protein [Paraburkholderia tropica]
MRRSTERGRETLTERANTAQIQRAHIKRGAQKLRRNAARVCTEQARCAARREIKRPRGRNNCATRGACASGGPAPIARFLRPAFANVAVRRRSVFDSPIAALQSPRARRAAATKMPLNRRYANSRYQSLTQVA